MEQPMFRGNESVLIDSSKMSRLIDSNHKSECTDTSLVHSVDFVVSYNVFIAVRLWDIAGRRCVVRYTGHIYPVHCVDTWYDVKHLLKC